MSSGRAFHKVGALWENALYPYVLRLYCGTTKSFFLVDLRFLLGIYGSNKINNQYAKFDKNPSAGSISVQ